MKSTKNIALMIGLALLLILAGCSVAKQGAESNANNQAEQGESNAGSNHAERTLVVDLTNEPANLDPGLNYNFDSFAVYRNIFDNLLSRDPQTGEIKPWIAESWEQESETVWTFTIREGVTFTNGDPLTAEDVVFSIERILDPEFKSPQAAKSDAVFVLEPALGPDGKLKTARKGVGRFTLEIEGVAAHSGIDHKSGVSALEELAHQILYLQGLTDYERGSTVNVGTASGGTAFNIVSPYAKAEVEVRVEKLQEAERLMHLITNLKPVLAKTKLTVTGGMVRPPMEQTLNRRLYQDAKDIAAALGFDLGEASTGGASDGNFTAALGIPTLDGLGAVGAGAHTEEEYVELDHIVPRTTLLARLLQKYSS